MKRVALYVRVSTQEQAEEGYSVGAQLEKARLYCKSKEWIIVDEYVDAGFSGSNLDRPAMQKLIRNILKNPLYVGKFIYGGELYDSTHEAIIDQETFDRAQQITVTRRKRAEKQNPNPFRRTTLLSGLLYCGLCGARLSGDAYKTTKNGKKYYKYIYKCYSRKSDKNMRTVDRCDLRYMERDELDAIVWDEILSLNLIIKKDENAIFEKSDRIGDIKIIEKEIKKLDDKIVKLMDLYAIGSMPVDLLTSKVQALNEEKEKLIDNIERIEDEIPELDRDLIVKSIKSASEIKEHGSLDEQRALIFALIDRITVYPDKIHIKYRFN